MPEDQVSGTNELRARLEAEAGAIVGQARAEAQRIIQEANKAAARIRSEADRYAAQARRQADDDREVANATLVRAHQEALQIRSDADRHRETVQRKAEYEVTALTESRLADAERALAHLEARRARAGEADPAAAARRAAQAATASMAYTAELAAGAARREIDLTEPARPTAPAAVPVAAATSPAIDLTRADTGSRPEPARTPADAVDLTTAMTPSQGTEDDPLDSMVAGAVQSAIRRAFRPTVVRAGRIFQRG